MAETPVVESVKIEFQGEEYYRFEFPMVRDIKMDEDRSEPDPSTGEFSVNEIAFSFKPVKNEETGIVYTMYIEPEEPRDEYHTMSEIYHYRMLYNAAMAVLCSDSGFEAVKSTRHSDGELCFGGGWFIVVIELPSGQVSNHYKMEYWDLFAIPDVYLPPEYDGHTPEIAAKRLEDWLRGMSEVR